MIYENCTVWRNHKRQGEWGELRFMAAALAHGFNVMRPWGDSSAYDVVLEEDSRFLRIQVKSTGIWHRRRGRRVYNFFTGRGDGRRYRLTDVDFYILYIAPEDLFYVIPPRALCGKKGVTLCPSVPGYRYEIYREAWHLLGKVNEEKDPHGLLLQGQGSELRC